MTLLLNDLTRNAEERLELWARDTIMRCDAMDIDSRDTITLITSVLVQYSIKSLLHFDISREDFLTIMQQAYEIQKREKQQDSEREATR